MLIDFSFKVLGLFCSVEQNSWSNIGERKLGNNCGYGKCSELSNTFQFLFTNKMLVIRAGSHKMLVRITNKEDSDQTTSSEGV